MIIRLTILVLLCLFVPPIQCRNPGDAGQDRIGSDLPGMPIQLQVGEKPEICSDLCDVNDTCKAWAYAIPNCDGTPNTPLCFLKGLIPKLTPNRCRVSGVKSHSLIPPTFAPFPLGSIGAAGWLKRQLEIQGQGLSGYLGLFWPDIAKSNWIGRGGDDWERTPYWLNGLVPLAFTLNDSFLLDQVFHFIDFILANQKEDGWLGPSCCDPWPRFPLVLALIQYAEANSTDTRTVPALMKFFYRLRDELNKNSLYSWAQMRWQDLVLAVHWMLDNHRTEENQQFLLDLAELAYTQGFDWSGFFAGNQFPTDECRGDCISLATHGVNNGQGLKTAAVWYRQSKDESARTSSILAVDRLFHYHGAPSGIFNCDEHLAGTMPSHGAELCTVVESMFSLSVIFNVFGEVWAADRVERLAYNALPSELTPDMWAHQYLQQGNQINAMHVNPNIYTSDGPDSTIYGLEPNFGCCTANFNQGWPKFVSRLYFSTQDGGIVVGAYAPSYLSTKIGGKKVSIKLDTDYPFDGDLQFIVDSQTPFPLYLRIPGWAEGATLQVGSDTAKPVPPGQFTVVQLSSSITQIRLVFPMKFRVSRAYNNAAVIERGPLVYALSMGEEYKELKHYSFNSSDWQITPITPWNYGIELDEAQPDNSIDLITRPMGSFPFGNDEVPLLAKVKGRKLPNWGVQTGAAAPPPMSPVTSDQPLEELTLLPFGATRLRIVEIPTLRTN